MVTVVPEVVLIAPIFFPHKINGPPSGFWVFWLGVLEVVYLSRVLPSMTRRLMKMYEPFEKLLTPCVFRTSPLQLQGGRPQAPPAQQAHPSWIPWLFDFDEEWLDQLTSRVEDAINNMSEYFERN